MPRAQTRKSAGKSSITFEQAPRERVRVKGVFVHRSARYEVVGYIDMNRRRAEPFRHRFTLNGQNVFDLSVASGTGALRSEFKFGAATRGVRQLMLTTEPLRSGTLTTGTADGMEILPVLSRGCSCKGSDLGRSVLAWGNDGSAKQIKVSLRSAKIAGDLEGLANVIETTVARVNSSPFGDLIDCIRYALCLLICAGEFLWCWIRTLGTPGPDIFVELCSVVSGGCATLCKFEHTFPS